MKLESDHSAVRPLPWGGHWKQHLEPRLRTIFARAVAIGPLTTVEERLRLLLTEKWPGLENEAIFYDESALRHHLWKRRRRDKPVFGVPFLPAFLGASIRAGRHRTQLWGDLKWLTDLMFHFDPGEKLEWEGFLQRVDPSRAAVVTSPLQEGQRYGPVTIRSEEWLAFRESFTAALFFALVWFSRWPQFGCMDHTLYPQESAGALALELCKGAERIAGRAGNAIVLRCADDRSWSIMKAVDQAVSRQSGQPLAEVVSNLLYNRKHIKTMTRQISCAFLWFVGYSTTEIARQWLDSKLIEPVELEGADPVPSARRQVFRTKTQIRSQGQQRCHGRR